MPIPKKVDANSNAPAKINNSQKKTTSSTPKQPTANEMREWYEKNKSTTFEIDDTVDENHRGMMRLKFRIFHTGLNRNKSYVSKDAAEKAMNTIADRPVWIY